MSKPLHSATDEECQTKTHRAMVALECSAGALGQVVLELGKINKKLEKFLARDDVRIKDHLTMARDTAIPKPSFSFVGHCSWCMADIKMGSGGDEYNLCDHATLCGACSPCDECEGEKS